MCDGCPLLAAVREEVRQVVAEVQRPATGGPLLVTVAQAASMLGIGQTETYRLVSTRELPSVKLGRSRRVVVRGLEEYVRRLQEVEGQDSG